jgi:murein DD-endopeptidase MepM/ murein hydrolase activator NlpD
MSQPQPGIARGYSTGRVRSLGSVVYLVISVVLVACGTVHAAAPEIVYVTATLQATQAIEASPTEFIVSAGQPTGGATVTPFPTTDYESTSIPTSTVIPPTVDALSFDYGTVTPYPTLSWRPPPMQVPVSIRPEDHFWFSRPIASNQVNWPHPLYRYGSTYFGFMNSHTGVDIDAQFGTPVLAAGDGVVVWTGYGLYGVNPPEDDPYGIAVAIKHNFGYNNQDVYTIYAHMSGINVWLNQPVRAGEQIGEVGSTGFSSGPHLHFEVRIGENKFRSTYNPELWLAPPTGWGVLVGRVLDRRGNYISELPVEVYDSAGRYYPVQTYSTRNVNMDPIYQENFALSDLPAGTYSYAMNIGGERYIGVTDIRAGQSTFVTIQEGMPPRGGIPRTAEPLSTNGAFPSVTPGGPPTSTPRPPLPSPTPPFTPRPTFTLEPPTATP